MTSRLPFSSKLLDPESPLPTGFVAQSPTQSSVGLNDWDRQLNQEQPYRLARDTDTWKMYIQGEKNDFNVAKR